MSFEIEPMFHAARDVPAHEITSVVDVEEARVGGAWKEIRVKSSISESHPAFQLVRGCSFRLVIAGKLGAVHPDASKCGPRIDGARNVDCLEPVRRKDEAMKPAAAVALGRSVDARDFTS